FVNKKLKALRGCQPDKIKQKLWGMLSRRGFSANVIHKAVKAVERTAGNLSEK
ncbi:MAG: RecX family transcriptional regulator, partial [Nitrospirae bacterium]|nr:RecX family transcriptional regulator [Nitrospirota bacterium]